MIHKLDRWLETFKVDRELERRADRALLVFLLVVFVLFIARGLLLG